MKVKLQGTIVSADYDDGFFADWIEKGVITPSSKFVREIEDSTEPIDLYINSYGGDVFAGGEMMIAVLKAFAAGKLGTVEVGSIAASMAANIVASLRAAGVPVTANANTELMFHGCYTETIGGAQHHEDVAESLRNTNETVMANLNKLGITDCRAWFAEGREKWIGAEEGLKMGLFTAVSGSDAAAPADAKATATRLAAFASHVKTRLDYSMSIDETVPVKPEEPVENAVTEEKPLVADEPATAPVVEDAPAVEERVQDEAHAVVEDELEMRAQRLADARFAGLQSAHDKMISDLTKERDEARDGLASASAEVTSLKGEVEKLTASLADLRDQLARAEANRQSVCSAVLGHAEPTAPSAAKSAREILASLPPSKRAAYYKAHQAEIDKH